MFPCPSSPPFRTPIIPITQTFQMLTPHTTSVKQTFELSPIPCELNSGYKQLNCKRDCYPVITPTCGEIILCIKDM